VRVTKKELLKLQNVTMRREIYESKVFRPDAKKLEWSVGLVWDEKYILSFFIWPDVKSMRKFTEEGGDHDAFFAHPEIVVENGKVRGGDVGYIHLVLNKFGAGTFAHELQHFLQTWIMVNDYDPVGNDWEDIAYLAGYLTTEFFNNYWEVFEVEPGTGKCP